MDRSDRFTSDIDIYKVLKKRMAAISKVFALESWNYRIYVANSFLLDVKFSD